MLFARLAGSNEPLLGETNNLQYLGDSPLSVIGHHQKTVIRDPIRLFEEKLMETLIYSTCNVYIYICACVCVCVCARMCKQKYRYMHVCVCAFICSSIYLSICLFVYRCFYLSIYVVLSLSLACFFPGVAGIVGEIPIIVCNFSLPLVAVIPRYIYLLLLHVVICCCGLVPHC